MAALVALAFLLQACSGVVEGGQANCSRHSPLVGLRYTYQAAETRISSIFRCGDSSSLFSPPVLSSVYQVPGLVDLATGCLNHTVISGLAWTGETGSGDEDTGAEEREIEVAACSLPPAGSSLEYCSWSRWLARPKESFSVQALPAPWVLRSLLSHSVRRSYRYKLELCYLTGSPNLFKNSCHLPHVPHGSIKSISHTHSLTQSQAPFKIKMKLDCESGYRQNGRLAVCENGTWTQLPLCHECEDINKCKDFAPVVTTNQLSVGFVASSNLTLNCDVRGWPTPSVSWHRVLLPSGVRVPLTDDSHFVHHDNGSVTIVNVSDPDSGPYVCWAQNVVGSDIAYIHIYNSLPDGSGPPSIHHWSPLHTVPLSHPHTLTSSQLHCYAQGFPPPIVSWSTLPLTSSHPHTFHPITSSTISQHPNGTLIFNPVQTTDTAIYRCEAANLFGTVSMETIFFIAKAPEDGEAPVISGDDWVSSHNVSLGARLELGCSASSHNSSSLSWLWMKKGGRVPMSGTRVWQHGNGTLVIESILPEDEGFYWCVVWGNGHVAMEMTRIVIGDSNGELTSPPTMAGSASGLHGYWLTLTPLILLLF